MMRETDDGWMALDGILTLLSYQYLVGAESSSVFVTPCLDSIRLDTASAPLGWPGRLGAGMEAKVGRCDVEHVYNNINSRCTDNG